MCVPECVSCKPCSYFNVEMNSYLFTQKRSECEDPKGKVQNNTERGRQRRMDIDPRERAKQRVEEMEEEREMQ